MSPSLRGGTLSSGARQTLPSGFLLFLGVSESLCQQLVVLGGFLLPLLGTLTLLADKLLLLVESSWSDETLNLGRLRPWFLGRRLTLLDWEWPSDNKLADIIFLRQIE